MNLLVVGPDSLQDVGAADEWQVALLLDTYKSHPVDRVLTFSRGVYRYVNAETPWSTVSVERWFNARPSIELAQRAINWCDKVAFYVTPRAKKCPFFVSAAYYAVLVGRVFASNDTAQVSAFSDQVAAAVPPWDDYSIDENSNED